MKESSDSMIVVGALLAGAILATGQDSGHEWKLRSAGPDQVLFTVERSLRNGHWSSTNTVPLANFRGLSPDMLTHAGSAKFEYVQDAGRLLCKGSFSLWGRGSGSFTFVPNPAFVAELQKLGYGAPTDQQIFSMMMSNVNLEFARGVKDAGLNASTDQLVELRIHGVTLPYIREAQKAGYRNFRAKEYTELKIHGVSTEFLSDLRDYGYDLSAQQIIELRIHGVNSKFMDDLKQAGYNLSASQITELKIHGVDSSFISDLKSYGLQPRASDLVQFKIHGVTPEYLKGLKDAGYTSLPESQITELKIHGVSTDFMRRAAGMGYHFGAHDLTELHIHGVDAAYLQRLQESGMRNLSVDEITKLKIHGVD